MKGTYFGHDKFGHDLAFQNDDVISNSSICYIFCGRINFKTQQVIRLVFYSCNFTSTYLLNQ